MSIDRAGGVEFSTRGGRNDSAFSVLPRLSRLAGYSRGEYNGGGTIDLKVRDGLDMHPSIVS